MDSLNRKNAAAFEQAIKSLDAQIREQQKRIDGLVATIGGMGERVAGLEQSLLQMRVVAFGHGSST